MEKELMSRQRNLTHTRRLRMSFEKSVVMVCFIVGILMSFLIPTWETPDEYSHIRMIGVAVGRDDLADVIMEDIPIEKGRIEFHPEEKVDLDELKEAISKKPDYSRGYMLPRKIKLSFVKHFPAYFGMMIGCLFGLPSFWVLQIGELFSLLFYCFVCYKALTYLPCNKEALAIIMLFPTAIQQAGSVSYDAVLIPLCFLMIAYTLHLKYDREVVGLKEVCCFLLLWGVITYIKLPYVFLIFLSFVIPLDKIHINIKVICIDGALIRKVRWPVNAAGGIVCVGGIYVLRKNMWIQIIWGFLSEFRRGLFLFAETGRVWGKFMIQSTVGTLGWLDTPISFKIVILTIIVLVAVSILGIERDEKNRYGKNRWDYFVLVALFAGLCVLVSLGLVNHTVTVILFGKETTEIPYNIHEVLYQIPYIGGLQGRYYLPFLPVLFFALPKVAYVKKEAIYILIAFQELLLFGCTFAALVSRYWIG